MIDRLLTITGIAVFVLAWAGPLPGMVRGSFAAHMTLHLTVVGIGIPFAGRRDWPLGRPAELAALAARPADCRQRHRPGRRLGLARPGAAPRFAHPALGTCR